MIFPLYKKKSPCIIIDVAEVKRAMAQVYIGEPGKRRKPEYMGV